ncbi:MAG: hypothetical protein Q4G40_03460 [Brachybacterium sp.]|nr:hypothetical protein [Brachybacterium sp.]
MAPSSARDDHQATPSNPPPRTSPQPPTPPRPSALAGRTDPARRVRPVDWTATGARDTSAPATQTGPPAAPARPAGPGARRRPTTIEVPRALPAPPPQAIHSLTPDDARPLLRPLRLDEGDVRVVGLTSINRERMILTVAEPEEAWTADAGTSDHFLRGELVVQVRRADNAVIGAFSRGYALSVRPDGIERALPDDLGAAGPSARGGAGTRHPTSRRELLELLHRAGFEVRTGRGHGRVTHPAHPGLFVPLASTPSDVRFTRHAVTQIRRVFGIDLRR